MIKEPEQAAIDAAFEGTNFGLPGETPEGRKRLVAECVLKRACGFRDGHTIETICKQLCLLTAKGNPYGHAKRWACCHLLLNN